MEYNKSLQFCPLMTVGANGIDMVCTGEKCAWYLAGVKKCSVYVMAYNAVLEANQRQKETKKRKTEK